MDSGTVCQGTQLCSIEFLTTVIENGVCMLKGSELIRIVIEKFYPKYKIKSVYWKTCYILSFTDENIHHKSLILKEILLNIV